ncbi:MAG: imidazoleglycerol-phosphate dehydratase HisB [Oscillospiraceae bacterium]|nr:imidazoleglycerol-phosphate dehydratase HisB [Oscillospiraceae bacterium]
MRKAAVTRNTNETRIELALALDGKGKSEINTGVGFLDHMLTLFAAHGRFDLSVTCSGDLHVDAHHTVEDIGIALGQAFGEALGEKRGITRYGSFTLPMDEALVMTAIDISGRASLNYSLSLPCQLIGSMDAELIEEFFLGFTRAAGITLHIKRLDGKNTHHIIEAAFKGFGRALAQAVKPDTDYGSEIPSTKGIL